MAQIGDLLKTDAKLLGIHSVATLGHLDQCFDKCMFVSLYHLLFDISVTLILSIFKTRERQLIYVFWICNECYVEL